MQAFRNAVIHHSRLGLLGLALLMLSGTAMAADTYKRLSKPQPTDNPDKIEIVEVFWYGCPHCYDFEPHLNKWLENKPDDVDFKRMPAVFRQDWLAHAKAYYTALELGVVDQVHSDIFTQIHEKRNMLNNESALKAFFVEHGVDGDAFTKTYNSRTVESHIKQALGKLRRYEITGVPAVVINGKYMTSGPIAGSYDTMIQTMNELIEKERAAMQAAN